MRTLLMVVAGMVLALAFHLIAVALRRRGAGSVFDGEPLFIWIWLAVACFDFWVGVEAGNAVPLELGVHWLIFALPAAFAWYLWRLQRRSLTASP